MFRVEGLEFRVRVQGLGSWVGPVWGGGGGGFARVLMRGLCGRVVRGYYEYSFIFSSGRVRFLGFLGAGRGVGRSGVLGCGGLGCTRRS